ncbi:DNA repair protein RecO [Mycoplasma miroungirhinis]|uniref:DNA repair protein RecO n=1 Tax=Mycoplasma miroungirhinis TaxID=754516 RepID=A0A6M4JH24_9MOLU|nr:DNA repair protein RecO [Mycoplasma miroungirhinis]QJR44322.1 DNA repair protein RecO [Mycoplasma miroungirhinis]
MEKIYKGIVINKQPYADADEIVTILTPSKKITFVAKGTQKPLSKNRVSLQLLNVIEVEIFEARLVSKISKLKTSTTVISFNLNTDKIVTIKLLKLLNALKENFYLVTDICFDLFENFGYGNDFKILLYILNQALYCFGLYPNYKGCVICNRKDQITNFEFYQGGYLCFKHSNVNKDSEYLKSIYFLNKDFDEYQKNFNKFYIREVFNELWQFLEENTYI